MTDGPLTNRTSKCELPIGYNRKGGIDTKYPLHLVWKDPSNIDIIHNETLLGPS